MHYFYVGGNISFVSPAVVQLPHLTVSGIFIFHYNIYIQSYVMRSCKDQIFVSGKNGGKNRPECIEYSNFHSLTFLNMSIFVLYNTRNICIV